MNKKYKRVINTNKNIYITLGILLLLAIAIPTAQSAELNKVINTKNQLIDSKTMWLQYKLYDNESLPITMDVIINSSKQPTKTIYVIAGSSQNFRSSFLTPLNKNIATFLASKGYAVIGITSREDSAPSNFNYTKMKNWNLQFHTNDVKKVINYYRRATPSSYEILGYSAGALYAFQYASQINDTNLKALRIIDMATVYQPNINSFNHSKASYKAYTTLINRKVYADTSFSDFKQLSAASKLYPNSDSGASRYPLRGNFTYKGLLYYSLINTNQLPGLITPYTGLSENWHLKKGLISGIYTFNTTASNGKYDKYSFKYTPLSTLYSASGNVNSGVFPLATEKDISAVWSNNYYINWNNIKVPVYWMNMQYGFGYTNYSTTLLKNSKVTYGVIKGYEHGDATLSATAEKDVWKRLFPS